ncbi:MAG: elongation factor P [Candidatus Eisenbacteria bacterium]
MATTADIRNGLVLDYKNDLYKVVDFQHVKPGKGGAFVRAKLKNLKTGRVLDDTWNAGSTIYPVAVRYRPIQYLYASGAEYVFMDTETYEQIELPAALMKPYLPYLTESMEMQLMAREDDGSTVDVVFPATVTLLVTEAHDAARGDSAGSVTKPVKVETGYELQVPPFISEGEKIRVDTSTGKYLERVN